MRSVTDRVRISAQHCGPPDSANGGYTCGVTAAAIGGSDVEVTLRAPPPLDRALTLERHGGEATLRDGDTVIAVARPANDPVIPSGDDPPPVGLDEAAVAADAFDVEAYRDEHEFPGCYTCGPDRAPGDGLRIFPAPMGRRGLYASPWTPDESLADDAGLADVPVLWAALDCPGGLASMFSEPEVGAMVLGKLAVVVRRAPSVGETSVVAGWAGAAEGRRRRAGSAIWSASGELLAAGRATWVVLTAEQRAAFRSTRP